MEGGAMRGMFTCGVIDVLLEHGVRFDGAAGISAGAVFGCNYKSHQIGRPIRYNKKYGADPRYCSIRSLLKTGDLYGADFCYHVLPDVLDPFDRETFRRDPTAFYIGAVDVRTGQMAYHLCTDGGAQDMLWMRASASMPLVSRPVPIGDRLFLDGGIVDAVPYAYMESIGYDRNVIVLTRPAGYVKQKSSALPLAKVLLRRYPAVIEAMAVRHERYNAQMRQIAAREQAGQALVLRPPQPLGIRRTEKDPAALERVYQTGRQVMNARLEELKAFLARDPAAV
ncbi:MAG: patatin family protein [Clostridia bacterium]|nr:patatin family protein [Clostridia bacterium]